MRHEQEFIDGVTGERRVYVTEGYVVHTPQSYVVSEDFDWDEPAPGTTGTLSLALESIARWARRDDLSVERRLAAIRRVCHVALNNAPE